MNSASQLVELVNLWHEYEKGHKSPSIADFSQRYLTTQTKAAPHASADRNLSSTVNRIGTLFGRLARFTLIYSKKALAPVNLYNTVDFSYLKTLAEHRELKKSDLINLVVTDFTTGIEVIKRMIKNGYAVELPDPEDKRSKRILITAKGMDTLQKGSQEMRALSELFFDKLTEEEIYQLSNILEKINDRHTLLFKDYKNEDFPAIMSDFRSKKESSLPSNP